MVPVVLGLVAVAVVALVVILLTGSDEEEGGDASLMVTARDGATAFFSLDYRRADKDVDAVLALSTGTFKKEYAARRQEIIDGVVEKKLVVTASIPEDGAAVEFLDETKAQVLVAVDVTTATSGGESTRNRYRARVLLTRTDDRWLVSGLNQVG